jgi:hypothetical protein
MERISDASDGKKFIRREGRSIGAACFWGKQANFRYN